MSNKYSPMPPKVETDRYAYYELQDLARAISEPQPELQLQVLYAAPKRPRDGMIVVADGTSWNPGSGAGAYRYQGGSWSIMGAGGGGVADGDKGDITVSGGGTVWTLDLNLSQISAPTGSVNFNGQQATSFRIENRTSDPVSPTTGQIWLRTDL